MQVDGVSPPPQTGTRLARVRWEVEPQGALRPTVTFRVHGGACPTGQEVLERWMVLAPRAYTRSEVDDGSTRSRLG